MSQADTTGRSSFVGLPSSALPLDIAYQRDRNTSSWRRAIGTTAVWDDHPERSGGWKTLAFKDGQDAHTVFVARIVDQQGRTVGWAGCCDCERWQYASNPDHDQATLDDDRTDTGAAPCSHLCRLVQEAQIDRVDVPEVSREVVDHA